MIQDMVFFLLEFTNASIDKVPLRVVLLYTLVPARQVSQLEWPGRMDECCYCIPHCYGCAVLLLSARKIDSQVIIGRTDDVIQVGSNDVRHDGDMFESCVVDRVEWFVLANFSQ